MQPPKELDRLTTWIHIEHHHARRLGDGQVLDCLPDRGNGQSRVAMFHEDLRQRCPSILIALYDQHIRQCVPRAKVVPGGAARKAATVTLRRAGLVAAVGQRSLSWGIHPILWALYLR